MVAYNDSEMDVGLAAKQGRIRNAANTITNNKRILSGEIIDNYPVTLLQRESGSVYQVCKISDNLKNSVGLAVLLFLRRGAFSLMLLFQL